MRDITLQEAAHKNIILWNLMRKLDFWKVKRHHDVNNKVMTLSIGKPTNGSGHWCKQFMFDRLKSIDDKGNAHIYKFLDRNSHIWNVRSEFNFFPTGASRALVLARAELLDHLIENFPFGLKWKKEYLMAEKFLDIYQACIEFDLNFSNHDVEMEKSLVSCVELSEMGLKSPLPF